MKISIILSFAFSLGTAYAAVEVTADPKQPFPFRNNHYDLLSSRGENLYGGLTRVEPQWEANRGFQFHSTRSRKWRP